MKPSDSIRMHRAVIRRLVESHHARNARVFGSVVRGEDTDGIDTFRNRSMGIIKLLWAMLIFAPAQAMAADCQVLLPEGATHYVGECSGKYAHGHGKAFIPSRSDPTGYYEGEFNNGKLQGQATYIFLISYLPQLGAIFCAQAHVVSH